VVAVSLKKTKVKQLKNEMNSDKQITAIHAHNAEKAKSLKIMAYFLHHAS